MVAGRLLIVDDEPGLAGLLRRFLEREGFQVDIALNGADAVALFEQAPQSYSLLVTDMTMDGVSGEDLIARLRETRPALPAIAMSGYPHVPTQAHVGFLQKPFLPKMLVDAVRAILE